jgi:WD40 repeat protein
MRHRGFILATSFNRDGTRLYSGSVEGIVNVWDVATAELVESWQCHAGPILDIRLSADGRRLLTASKDRTAGVWDAENGASVSRLSGHGGGVFCVGAAGDRIASGSFDGTLRIWDARTERLLETLSGHTDAVTNLVFLSENRLVSGSRDRTLRVWDPTRSRCEHILERHRYWVTKLRALPDRRGVLSAGEDGMCNLWNCESGNLIWSRTLDIPSPIWGFDVAPSGEFAIAGAGPARLDTRSGESKGIPQMSGYSPRAIAVSPDNATVAFGCDDGDIVLYDTVEQEIACTLAGAGRSGLSLAVDDAGESVGIGHLNGAIEVRPRNANPTTRDDAHERFVYTLCRIDAHRFASGAFDGVVRVWDFATGEPLNSLVHGGLIFSLAASPDGQYLLSGGTDAIRLWDLEATSPIVNLESIGSGVHTIGDFRSSVIVSAGDDALLHCWDTSGKPIRTHELEDDATSGLKLLPDGRRAVIGNAYGRVSMVDLASGKIERLHDRHEDWIRGLHVSPGGRLVVTVSQDCECCVYDLEAHRLLSLGPLNAPIPAADIDAEGRIVALTADGAIVRAFA